MSPEDNGGSEDFVFVDSPDFVFPLRGGHNGSNTFNPAVETDYVTVDNDNPATSADQDILMEPAPDEGNQPMVQIEYFEPMPLAAFPEEINHKLLMGPIPSKYQALRDEVSQPSSPDSPHSLFVENSILLFEGFIHFAGVHSKIGRDRVLETVGMACELSSKGASTLQQHVGGTLDTLRESRVAFLQRTERIFVPWAQDPNVRELARLVDRYIRFESEEPLEVDDTWYMDPALDYLWTVWQKIVDNKDLRPVGGRRATGKHKLARPKVTTLADITTASDHNNDTLVSEAVEAAGRLEAALIRLEACGGLSSGGMWNSDKILIRQALDRVTRWGERMSGFVEITPRPIQDLDGVIFQRSI